MSVLAIDTSNYPLAVAIVNEKEVVGEIVINTKRNHSIGAMPAIEQLLKECKMTPADLTKIVVAKGPGSYTGVRIGVTLAKTLAWSLKIPISGVSSLAALTGPGRYFPGVICPVFDARRGQVYTGLYRYGQDGSLETVVEDTNILMTEWVEQLKKRGERVLFVGQGVTVHQEAIEVLGDLAVTGSVTEQLPRASELAVIGAAMVEEEVHAIVPNYIRLAEAEAKWLEAQKSGESS